MKRKIAIITVELVEETAEKRDNLIKQQLAEWFQEDVVLMPWVKKLRNITIIEEN